MIALLEDSQKVIERLQRRGVVELNTCRDERLIQMNTSNSIAQFEKSISTANAALEFLDKTAEKKASLLAMLDGRKEMTTAEFAQKKESTDKTLRLCSEIIQQEKRITALEGEISKAATRIDILKPWLRLELPQKFGGTKTTRCFIGTVPGEISAEQLEKAAGDIPVCAETISMQKEQSCICIICLKQDGEKLLKALRDIGFSPLGSDSTLTPEQETRQLRQQIEEHQKEINDCRESVKKLDGRQDDIRFLIDFLIMRRDKYDAISKAGMTEKTIIIDGFIPEKYVNGLIKEFESKYRIAIDISDPAEDDDAPVLLQNGKFSSPVEGITEMYSLPGKNDVDPNPVMAFFYYLFFGMMLSDAGYGLVMTVATIIILNKTKVEGALRRSLTMFRNCGISTLFWGILFGSWFGDLPQTIAKQFFGKTIKTTALWFEPLDDPIKLLLFSFGLGIIHLFIGLAVNFKIQWTAGKKLDAVFDNIPIYLMVLGVAPIGASILSTVPAVLVTVGKYLALVGVVAIILTSGRSNKNIFMRLFGGIYGLYNTATGYLSDILSYSRLLALGLATGSIASVINLIGTMPQNLAVKAVMLTVVGLVGHIANMGVNLLGAYVHADRLQFVELFSKFYEGGGKAFRPLKANTKFIKLKKENIYEQLDQ